MSDKPSRPDRRFFLQKSVALVPASALAAGGLTACDTAEPVAWQDPAAPARVPIEDYRPRFFTDVEWAFVRAACDRLIPSDEHGPGAVELGVPNFIDIQLDGPFGHAAYRYMQGPFAEDAAPELGYQARQTPREVYRAGIAATDQACGAQYGKRFAELAPQEQDAVLTALEQGKLESEAVSLGTFFEFLWDNVSEGYLADPIHGGNRDMGAWKMIGFPGARADFVDWAPRHNQPYPLGPVSIQGQRG